VLDEVAPVGILVVKVLFLSLRQRTHLEKELVAVGGPIVEAKGWRRACPFFSSVEEGVEPEVGREKERTVVVGIVTHEKIGHRRLR